MAAPQKMREYRTFLKRDKSMTFFAVLTPGRGGGSSDSLGSRKYALGRLMIMMMIPIIRKAQGSPTDLIRALARRAKAAPPTPPPAYTSPVARLRFLRK